MLGWLQELQQRNWWWVLLWYCIGLLITIILIVGALVNDRSVPWTSVLLTYLGVFHAVFGFKLIVGVALGGVKYLLNLLTGKVRVAKIVEGIGGGIILAIALYVLYYFGTRIVEGIETNLDNFGISFDNIVRSDCLRQSLAEVYYTSWYCIVYIPCLWMWIIGEIQTGEVRDDKLGDLLDKSYSPWGREIKRIKRPWRLLFRLLLLSFVSWLAVCCLSTVAILAYLRLAV